MISLVSKKCGSLNEASVSPRKDPISRLSGGAHFARTDPFPRWVRGRLAELTAGGMSTSSAVKMAAKDLGMRKSDVYRIALAMPGLGGGEGEA